MDELLALESNDIDIDDENRGRALIDLASPTDMNLHDRSDVNTGNKSLLDQRALELDQQLAELYDNIFDPPAMNMQLVARLVSELMPVEEIAQLFGVGRDEMTAFVENNTSLKFTDFISRFQTKSKHDIRRWLLESAENGNPQSLLFLSKNFLGLKDQPDDKGKQVIMVHRPDLGALPDKKPTK